MSETETERQEPRYFQTLVALLIAAVSVCGALVAWWAAVSADGAGDADLSGLRATINRVEAQALAALNSYDDYGSFVVFKRYRELGGTMERQMAELEDEDERWPQILAERASLQDLQVAAQTTFPNQFLNRDGSYALERQRGQLIADVGRERDLNAQPSYDEADALRHKNDRLLLALTILSLALVFYTLIETVESRPLRWLLLACGTLLLALGAGGAYLVENGLLT